MPRLRAITASFGLASILLLVFSQIAWCGSKGNTAAPINIHASLYWDGNDGPWSSFIMQVGTPPQNVRLLPSTSGNALWVVLPDGCSYMPGEPSNCAELRGFEFNPNVSSTWDYIGLYQLGLADESLLGYSGNAKFGYENVTLGWQGGGLPNLDRQIVQGFATKDFYIGSLGISPYAVNITNENNPHPSLVGALRQQNKIPSNSWAYTAGAYYQVPAAFGSLTLGGFDTTRFIHNNVSCTFGADPSRELLIGIQSIEVDTTGTRLLTTPIFALINSLVPHIWLPLEVCEAFQQAFNLTWNSASGLYMVTDDVHASLLDQNANVTFRLGPSLTGGDTVDIIMPYGTFDLTTRGPYMNLSSRYFPLRRAQNASQYTLGRTFLQQAYVIADYDRSNFSVSQALFPFSSIAPTLVPILAPDSDSNAATNSALSTGATVGIVIGVVLFILLVLSIATFLIWRRRRERTIAEANAKVTSAAGAEEVDGRYHKAELDTVEQTRKELDITSATSDAKVELDGQDARYEVPAGSGEALYELPAEDILTPELESGPVAPRLKFERRSPREDEL